MRKSQKYNVFPDQTKYDILYVDKDRCGVIEFSEHDLQFERDEQNPIITLIFQNPDRNFMAIKLID